MRTDQPRLLSLLSLACLAVLLAGCAAPPAPGAAAEATAIIQRAQATAAALRAQAAATATAAPAPRSLPAAPAAPTEPLAAEESVTQTVELTGVGYAAEGAYIIVRFKAPPQVARRWMQGSVSVRDETTGRLYNEIPTMPLIGPLLGHPAKAGQPGYVMLVNTPPGLVPGSLVTVVLGDFKQEHVPIQP
jgi:hypothetical protein